MIYIGDVYVAPVRVRKLAPVGRVVKVSGGGSVDVEEAVEAGKAVDRLVLDLVLDRPILERLVLNLVLYRLVLDRLVLGRLLLDRPILDRLVLEELTVPKPGWILGGLSLPGGSSVSMAKEEVMLYDTDEDNEKGAREVVGCGVDDGSTVGGTVGTKEITGGTDTKVDDGSFTIVVPNDTDETTV